MRKWEIHRAVWTRCVFLNLYSWCLVTDVTDLTDLTDAGTTSAGAKESREAGAVPR